MHSSFLPHNLKYSFTITANEIANRIPKTITVQIVNNEHEIITLNNLVFNFYIDDGGYWGTLESVRYLDRSLVLKPKQQLSKTLVFDSLIFTSFVGSKPVSINIIKVKMRGSKRLTIKASMSDLWRKRNSIESSFLTHSNSIEIN
jgi:hypothetical protein